MSKMTKLVNNPKLFFADAYRKRIGAWFLTKSFIVVAVIPFALAVFYYLFFAAERYVSESVVSIRQAKDSSSIAGSGIAALVGINTNSKEDTLYLREYIHSLDMLKNLEKEINLREIYTAEKLDFLYRFYGFLSQEDFLEYYQNRVQIAYDDMSGLLKINVEAFKPEDAQKLSILILKNSETFVNELSHIMSRKQLEFAEAELKKSESRFSAAKDALLNFQNTYGIFNPIEQAQSQANLALEFEAELAKKEAELTALSSYMQSGAPQVVTLKNEIAAIKAQIRKEQNRVAKKSDNASNILASEYQTLSIEANFAEELYRLSLQAVEQARIESTKQIKYLSIVQTPSMPESAKYPRKIYNLITLIAILFLLYGITQLIKATIEDHKY
ncbi:MAG: capsule biosynthesis protein [Campylobacteraceae bacterium]|jgi:capsular polysaccharide transport system permease protein|nr:capsule biosynthesis protein [Campylobacteraceae bacterium]